MLLGALVGMPTPARGQVTSYVDEHGRRVFVNAEVSQPQRSPARLSGLTHALSTTSQPDQALTLPSRRSQEASRPGRGTSAKGRQAPKENLEKMAAEAAERHRIDPALVRAMIEAESNWDPTAVSSRGAQGLMQLVPATANRFGVADVFDAEQNLEGGVHYLQTLLERYGGDLTRTLAAYNAGEGAVERVGGVPNYSETHTYVQKVTDAYFRSGSDRHPSWLRTSRPVYRVVGERGRVVFTNE